jgi:hypothetical protein
VRWQILSVLFGVEVLFPIVPSVVVCYSLLIIIQEMGSIISYAASKFFSKKIYPFPEPDLIRTDTIDLQQDTHLILHHAINLGTIQHSSMERQDATLENHLEL